MSLLKRIEAAGVAAPRPGAGPAGAPVPDAPPDAASPGSQHSATPPIAPPSGPARPLPTSVISPARDRALQLNRDLKSRVKARLIAELDPSMDLSRHDEVRQRLQVLFDQIVETESVILTRAERQRLFEALAAAEFEDDEHVRRIIDRIVSPLGRHVDESSPICDARLPDGSRVNIVIPPISLIGPVITIRKFSKTPLTVDDLIRFGSLTREVAEFLKACVVARLNIVVSGGTGSGKTTLLNVLSTFIPDDERIITVEDAAELQLRQDHWVRLETRPANIEGKGAVTMRDCVRACLRMRPERIVVGECRGGEALDMLQAMNTGHDGSLTTGHANSPRDMLSRLETMVLMAGMDLPVRAIREQIASAVDLIVQQSRLRDGSRKIVAITEVQGMEGEMITLQDIFTFEQEAFEGGKVIGRIKPTGVRPKFMPKLEDAGIRLPPTVFGLSDRFF